MLINALKVYSEAGVTAGSGSPVHAVGRGKDVLFVYDGTTTEVSQLPAAMLNWNLQSALKLEGIFYFSRVLFFPPL